MTDIVKFSALLGPSAAGDMEVARIILTHYVQRDAAAGRVELPPNWKLTGVVSELVKDQWSGEQATHVQGSVIGARILRHYRSGGRTASRDAR